jgi:hypothetical protein
MRAPRPLTTPDMPQGANPGCVLPASLDLLAGVIEETMAAAGYSPRSMQAANRHDLRLLLRGWRLPSATRGASWGCSGGFSGDCRKAERELRASGY